MKPAPDTLVSRAEGSVASEVFTDDESGLFSTDYLADTSVYELLRADEQIHYLLVTDSNGLEIETSTSPDVETVSPDAGLNGIAAVTDKRILIAIGREKGDRVVELEPVNVTAAARERSLFSATVVFETTAESTAAARASEQTKAYRIGVKRRKSSDTGAAVEYVRQHHVPIEFAAGDEPTSVDLRANGGVSPENDGVYVMETEFIDDASAVPEQSLLQLAEAVGTVRHLDLSDADLNEAISELETAREQLTGIANEPGVTTEKVHEEIAHVESTLESLEEIRTVQARVERKLVLIDNGNDVPDATLADLLDSIEDATEVAEDLGLGTDALVERRASVAEQLDEPRPDKSETEADDTAQATDISVSTKWEWAGEDGDESGEFDADDDAESGRTGDETTDSDGVSNDPSREDLIEELHRVEAEIGKTPTPIYVRKYARYDKQVFLDEFESWDRVLDVVADDGSDESATDETTQSTEPSSGTTADAESSSGASGESSRSAILEDIERVADQFGNRPKLSEYESRGSYSQSDVYRHFDSWADALNESGVELPSQEELLAELERLASELGFPPREPHIDERGQYATYPYQLEFGSVNAALQEADLDVESHVRVRLADTIDSTAGRPTMSDFAENSPYSPNIIYKYWDSWGDALDDIRSDDSGAESSDSQSPDSHAEPPITQNELSELYEQLRNLQMLCGAIVEASEDALDDDTTDPMSAWLDCLEGYPEDAAAYGEQQRDRNSFSMRKYREEFGTGNHVTEFAETEARPPTTALRGLLDNSVDGDPSEFYLPVDSQTGASFPVVVESQSELDRAVQMLERLPKRPATANANTDPEQGTKDGTETSVSTTSRSSSGTTAAVDMLADVNGVTEEIADELIAEGYTTPTDLKDASIDELADVDAIGRQVALRIKLNVSD